MKTKIILTTVLSSMISMAAFSQEFDDMYFNSKDRAKLNEGKISADIGIARNTQAANQQQVNTRINPTDSYSARNINPEYSSQIDATTANSANDNYFVADYQPSGVNQNLSNCNCNSGTYYNPYYGNNAFNNPYYYGNMGGFGSPYGSYYPSYYGSPYSAFSPGLSMSLGYGWGGYSPGFYSGLGYGYGSYGNFWNPYSYYGSPWGYNSYYYPRQVIVVNGDNGGRNVVYQKRASRSSSLNNNVNNNYVRPSTNGSISGTSRSTVSGVGGRTRTSQPEYYDRGWKRNQDTNPSRGYWSNTNSNSGNTRSDFNWGGNSGGRSSGGFSNQPSRGSFNSGGSFNGGGSRMGGSPGGGSSGGSHTRGRNN